MQCCQLLHDRFDIRVCPIFAEPFDLWTQGGAEGCGITGLSDNAHAHALLLNKFDRL
jgi:hypothetical protein